MQEDLINELFGPEFGKKLRDAGQRQVERLDNRTVVIEELKDLAQGVLANEGGRLLLQKLVQLTYLKPVYPAPAGQTAGEYAAQCEGQRNIVAMLARWTEEE